MKNYFSHKASDQIGGKKYLYRVVKKIAYLSIKWSWGGDCEYNKITKVFEYQDQILLNYHCIPNLRICDVIN